MTAQEKKEQAPSLTIRERLQQNDRSVSSRLDPRLKKAILLDNPESLDVLFKVPNLSEDSQNKLEEMGIRVLKILGVAQGNITQEQLGELLEVPEVGYIEASTTVYAAKASSAADRRSQTRASKAQSEIAR